MHEYHQNFLDTPNTNQYDTNVFKKENEMGKSKFNLGE